MSIDKTLGIMQEFDCLYEHAPQAYINLRHLVSATYRHYLVSHSEKSFRDGDVACYTCYGVAVHREADFARYIGIPYYSDALYYVLCRKGCAFAAVYALDINDNIVAKQYFYYESDIQDLLHTFGFCLGKCKPGDIVYAEPASNTDTDKNDAMKGWGTHAV